MYLTMPPAQRASSSVRGPPATGDYAGLLRAVRASADQVMRSAQAIAEAAAQREADASARAAATREASVRADLESRLAAAQAERDQLAARIEAAEALEEADAQLRD